MCAGASLLTYSLTPSTHMELSHLQKTVRDRGAWCAAVPGVAESDVTEQQQITLKAELKNDI